jgi:hypothetical protein
VRSFIGVVPLSVLALALFGFVALVLSPYVARALKTRRSIAALLLLGVSLVLSATMVPTAAALEGQASDGVCDLSRMGVAPIAELTSVNFTSLNVLLFVPLGMAVGLLPRGRATALVAACAIALPFVVEGIQLTVTALGRGCQSADIVDNLLGLVIGIAIGLSIRGLSALAGHSRA